MVYIRSFVLKFQQQIGIQYGQNISISQLFSMLHELRIRNFAIIDQLELTFAAGLNILTGETGAGKSIILDALGMLLGNRAGAEWIRAGTELAEIEGVFHLDGEGEASSEVRAILEEQGLDDPDNANWLSVRHLLIACWMQSCTLVPIWCLPLH